MHMPFWVSDRPKSFRTCSVPVGRFSSVGPSSPSVRVVISINTLADYNRLSHVADQCAILQHNYWYEQVIPDTYPIPGIPILLFPVDQRALFLKDILNVRKRILEEANQGDSMAFLEHKELSEYVTVARRGLCELDEIRHTLVYQSIHIYKFS